MALNERLVMDWLGGRLYGDGDYIVEFEGGKDTQTPLSATVIDGKRDEAIFYAVKLDEQYATRRGDAHMAARIVEEIKRTPVAKMADAGITREIA